MIGEFVLLSDVKGRHCEASLANLRAKSMSTVSLIQRQDRTGELKIGIAKSLKVEVAYSSLARRSNVDMYLCRTMALDKLRCFELDSDGFNRCGQGKRGRGGSFEGAGQVPLDAYTHNNNEVIKF